MRHGLCLNIPLDRGFMAQIVAPRDLTKREAIRLCALIQTLVLPDPNEPAPRAPAHPAIER